MEETGFYRYLQPLLIYASLTGRFAAVNLLGKSTADLQFKYSSWPVLLAVVQQTILLLVNIQTFLSKTKTNFLVYCYAWLGLGLSHIAVISWLLTRSKDIISCIQDIHKLHETLIIVPKHLRPPPKSAKLFFGIIYLLLIIFHLAIIAYIYCFYWTYLGITVCLVFYTFSCYSPYVLLLILSCLFYCCSLVTQDSLRAWHLYCWVNCRPSEHLNHFCHMIVAQADILRGINQSLNIYLLTMFLFRIYTIYNGVTYFIYNDSGEVLFLVELLQWSVCLGLMFYCIQLTTIKFKRLAEEIFAMAARDLNKKHSNLVRVIMSQLQDSPWKLTVAGVKVKIDLAVTFMVMGLDYLILFHQNSTDLRLLSGDATSNTTTHSR